MCINTSDSDFNSVRKTIGSKTHTLTEAQMPKHYHLSNYWGGPEGTPVCMSYVGGSNNGFDLTWTSVKMENTASNLSTNYKGDGQAHNNIQPSFVVYIWERVA